MPNNQQRRTQRQAARKERLRKQKARRQKNRGSPTPVVTVTLQNLHESMRAGVELHHAHKFREAARIYRDVLKLSPDHVDALNSLAMIEHHAGRLDRALALQQRAIQLAGDHPGQFMNLGAIQQALGDMEAADAAYQHAIEMAPAYADPYYNLGDLYLQQGKPEKAIEVFDRCMATMGREYHALAYKSHALHDAGRHEEARYLLDFNAYVKTYQFETPDGYTEIAQFNKALARHISMHPTLQGNVMSTEHGMHTGELLKDPAGPMEPMQARIHEAIRWYIDELPNDPDHPAVQWVPKAWKLTSWGVVMSDKGHERAHIHPNGWLSGVFYLSLPNLIDDPNREPEGWLEFGRPTADLHVKSTPLLRHYRPSYGQMILFPSYFYHGTVPFRSKQRRICVAFDVEPL